MKIWKIYSRLRKKNNKSTSEKLLLKQAHTISYVNKINKQMKNNIITVEEMTNKIDNKLLELKEYEKTIE